MRKLLETPVQAAVCDVALAEPDGLALCRAARAHEGLAGIPFLLVGALDPAAKARAVEAGADDYLVKPVLLKELVQRVRHLIERRRLSDPGPPLRSPARCGTWGCWTSSGRWRAGGRTLWCVAKGAGSSRASGCARARSSTPSWAPFPVTSRSGG